MENIQFHQADIAFVLKDKKAIKKWITDCIRLESKQLKDVSYVFCSDDYLLQINIDHLDHNTYTDIITFDYTEDDIISSEIYISIDRVRENAKEFNHTVKNELHRVIIHGILHLVGYKDKTESDSLEMRSKEDYYLSLRDF